MLQGWRGVNTGQSAVHPFGVGGWVERDPTAGHAGNLWLLTGHLNMRRHTERVDPLEIEVWKIADLAGAGGGGCTVATLTAVPADAAELMMEPRPGIRRNGRPPIRWDRLSLFCVRWRELFVCVDWQQECLVSLTSG